MILQASRGLTHMLQELFGNKSVPKILLFLLINEKGYGSQIQSLLDTPLTPIQKALRRLEEGKIIVSSYEGKIRMYRLNPDYPLYQELEKLLKQAYQLLPTHEKRRFCFSHQAKSTHEDNLSKLEKQEELLKFWNLLKEVKSLSFATKSKEKEVLVTKVGEADVVVVTPSSATLVFQEKGHWLENEEKQSAFNSSFRWTLDTSSCRISLEHLRYGATRPVFLFDLTPTKPFMLEAVEAHVCAADTYLGSIAWNPSQIDFHWKIIGPSKNIELTYHYTLLS